MTMVTEWHGVAMVFRSVANFYSFLLSKLYSIRQLTPKKYFLKFHLTHVHIHKFKLIDWSI